MSVVCVTGAGGELGAAVVARLGADGHTVDAPPRAALDLLVPEDVERWAAGRRDAGALVHLVGGWRGGTPIDATPEEDVAWLHDQLVRTFQHATRAFLPALRANGGRVVLVSSTQVRAPDGENAAYGAAKAAAETWALALARDLGEHGGAANVLVVRALGDEPGFTPPADVAEMIALLLGPRGGRINGQRLGLHD